MKKCCKDFVRCISYMNFAKIVLIARILQNFCKNCFSCELGKATTKMVNRNITFLTTGSGFNKSNYTALHTDWLEIELREIQNSAA